MFAFIFFILSFSFIFFVHGYNVCLAKILDVFLSPFWLDFDEKMGRKHEDGLGLIYVNVFGENQMKWDYFGCCGFLEVLDMIL